MSYAWYFHVSGKSSITAVPHQGALTDLKLLRTTDTFRHQLKRTCFSLHTDTGKQADPICCVMCRRSSSRGCNINFSLTVIVTATAMYVTVLSEMWQPQKKQFCSGAA